VNFRILFALVSSFSFTLVVAVADGLTLINC
jgi:hypothetical protein